MKEKEMNFETAVIHKGYDSTKHHDSLVTPLYQTSTYSFANAEQGEDRFAGNCEGNIYSRLGNPTVRVLEERMAEIEGGQGALAFGSGMASVSAILIYLTKAGDHILCSRGIYGCTFGLLEIMEEKYKITHSLVSMTTEAEVENAIRPETVCIYVETPINPTMELVNLEAVMAVAKKHNIRVVVDNTFCSPYLQNPLRMGADFVLHSATKYLNGHGDVVGGVLVGSDAEEMQHIRMTIQKDVGGIMSPFDAWLLLRGLKTLHVRMDRHVSNAKVVLDFLKQQEIVKNIYYPFDESHPQVEIAKRQMREGGGLISFEIEGGKKEAQAFLNALSLIKIAVSLGDAETLIQHPATMTHAVVPPESRQAMGISDSLLRLSIGLEHTDDLIADLNKAFEQVKPKLQEI
ncbi:Methionine gamma-lyase [Planococcus halocryophilus Or1]|uniref:L-methionine gamma-lyase n=1 Tax=Planococcus halocryophilus TaxID=1215089 RepID=A0A1C7DMV1_9BACL|nr:methionine gamma-lyase [Planococcus halocryophilus]ANU12698.1 methionine gamma-lyase [Planococcus halocryophilus]EMF47104.1 Methionine gamma-lyase [Planococcus halocryophilus Or1]